nr:hypothetical protein BaRGS_023407 [Batillaria attramentaria]
MGKKTETYSINVTLPYPGTTETPTTRVLLNDDDTVDSQAFDVSSLATGASVSLAFVFIVMTVDGDSSEVTDPEKHKGKGNIWNFHQSRVQMYSKT